MDVARNKQVGRIQLKLSGVTTPSWSPDGKQLVFTGYDGGISDLYTINRDGTDLQRLTSDKYGDLHPVWSPDGKTIAFATDRGPRDRLQDARRSATSGSRCTTWRPAPSRSSTTWTRART